MRILVVGASGTIGSEVSKRLSERHKVIAASRTGAVRVELADVDSIERMVKEVGSVDAVVCCAASGAFAPLSAPDGEFWRGFDAKLVGQVNLLRRVLPVVRDDGSVTLTSGRLSEPVSGSAGTYLINSGLDAFVPAAATELPRGIRLNVINPGWVRETLIAIGMDPSGGKSATEVAAAYVRSVEGKMNGQVLQI
jgi:NAD(P)-dependent dehydrogenase (short-subunit alcohol dehydrogenase family)